MGVAIGGLDSQLSRVMVVSSGGWNLLSACTRVETDSSLNSSLGSSGSGAFVGSGRSRRSEGSHDSHVTQRGTR